MKNRKFNIPIHLKTNHIFWLITASVFVGMICPLLIRDGMFMDGQQYACVAKNLAEGAGQFWKPFLSETWWKAGSIYFMEHPPLIYGIQALFFKALGTSMYVERFYSFLMSLISAFIIVRIWNSTFKDHPVFKKYTWVPVLLWVITPVSAWSFRNNLMENTMLVFVLLSVYFLQNSLTSKKSSLIWLLFGGIAIFLATMSKGIPGLFTISFFLFYWLITRSISFFKVVLYTFLIILVPVLIYFVLLQTKEAYDFFNFYLNERLLYRVNNEPVVNNQFKILLNLLTELIPAFGVGLIFVVLRKIMRLKVPFEKENRNNALFFFLIGLSGTLPLILTPVQRGFYLVPAIPFFCLAIAILIVPVIDLLAVRVNIKSRGYKFFKISAILLLTATVVYSGLQVGKTGRDHNVLNDVYLIGNIIPEHTKIGVEESIYDHWNLYFYLIRYFDIHLTTMLEYNDYYLVEKGSDINNLAEYERIPLNTINYDLYKRIN